MVLHGAELSHKKYDSPNWDFSMYARCVSLPFDMTLRDASPANWLPAQVHGTGVQCYLHDLSELRQTRALIPPT